MPGTMGLHQKVSPLGKQYIQDRHMVGVVSSALMLHEKVAYKELLEALIVPELTPRFRSCF